MNALLPAEPFDENARPMTAPSERPPAVEVLSAEKVFSNGTRGLAPIDALKASFSTVRAHVGETLLSFLVQGLLVVAGLFACGVGILATGPIALLIQVYTYRRLSGGPIAPATP